MKIFQINAFSTVDKKKIFIFLYYQPAFNRKFCFQKAKSNKVLSPCCHCSFFFSFPKGHISTCGLAHYLGKVEEDDSVIVKVLKKQGAIPFVKTNVPQSMIKYSLALIVFGVANQHLSLSSQLSGWRGWKKAEEGFFLIWEIKSGMVV